MSYYRSYFEKNNTIIKDSLINTSKNPTTEIYYGSGFSKFIFKVDFTDLKLKVQNGDLVIDSDTKHHLKMTNTIFGNETFLGAPRGTGRDRAISFDLILFKIPQYWDEGVGFDYETIEYDFTSGNKTYDTRPSNWFNSTTVSGWTIEGIYSNSPTIIDTIHFDNGNENISVDITDYVNEIIVTGTTDYGLGLAFGVIFQDISVDADQSVAFFTKYTQTFFEPFVESYFDDIISDNRYDFTEKVNQKLYLYVTNDGNYYNLDELPIVSIRDNTNTPIIGLSGITATHVRKGVYEIEFGLSGITCDGKKFFYDKWSNLIINGISLSDVTQKFVPKPFNSKFSIGQDTTETKKYKIQFFGIKQNEKIVRGDIRKLTVYFKSIDNSLNQILDEVYYRMFINEGRVNVIVHDWTLMDKGKENFVFIDTSTYIPREYFLEIKAKHNGEEIFYQDYIKFELLSEK